MRILGQVALSKAIRNYPEAKKWLEAWTSTVEDAAWQSLSPPNALTDIPVLSTAMQLYTDMGGTGRKIMSTVGWDFGGPATKLACLRASLPMP